ncbi:hypothetical protein KKF91_20200 [Myxococcota bacterium]|nr:hypothetical protein [Myxococcota bacterium]MBU1432868.1 hypothetical protein [Myxococcota bacterium]MBU1898583.1 hypothetical protein [Myxococcota bacterium]
MTRSLLVMAWALMGLNAHAAPPNEQVKMSLERYRALLDQGTEAQVTWGPARVEVSVPEVTTAGVAVHVYGTFQVKGEGEARVPLLPSDLVLKAVEVDGQGAPVLREAGLYSLPIKDHQVHTLSLHYETQGGLDQDGRPFSMIPLPPVASASMTVRSATPVDVWPGRVKQVEGESTVVDLPHTPAALVRWEGPTGVSGVRSVRYDLSPDASGDGMDVTATFTITAADMITPIRIANQGAALLSAADGATPITCKLKEEWHIAPLKGRGEHTLTARFRLPIDRSHGQPKVTLELTQIPITQVTLTIPGKRSIKLDPPVPIHSALKGEAGQEITYAVADLPPSEQIDISWTETRAAPESLVRVNAESWQLLTLQEGVLRTRVLVDYDVINGKAKELLVQIPESVVLYKIIGDGIEDWRIFSATPEMPRHVRVSLGTPLESKARVELQAEMVVRSKEGAELNLPIMRPLQVFREAGVVALFDGDKVGFGLAEITGALRKVGEDALPVDIRQGLREKVNQAYKHVGAPGSLTSKVVAATTKKVRFDARINTLYLIREGALRGYAVALVELKSGRKDKITLSLPLGVAEPRITAPSLNKVERNETIKDRLAYDVRFTQALEGAVQIDVEFDLVLQKEQHLLTMPDLRVHEAEVESGHLGIAAETGMEVKLAEQKDLRKMSINELPKAIRLRTDLEILLGYHYAHAPWSLGLNITRHRTVETLNAEAAHVWLDSAVLHNGHYITEAIYQITNKDRQFLRLRLPEGSKVLKVKADGEEIKAVVDEEKHIAIPLPKNRAVRISLTYQQTHKPLRLFETIQLETPGADLRANDIKWRINFARESNVLHYEAALKDAPPYVWAQTSAGEAAPQTEPRVSGPSIHYLFTYPVHDDTTPLKLKLYVSTTPSERWGYGGLILAVLLLAYITRKRAMGRKLSGLDWGLLVIGVLLLLVKATLWRFDEAEGITIIGLLLAIGVGFYLRKRAQDKAAQG